MYKGIVRYQTVPTLFFSLFFCSYLTYGHKAVGSGSASNGVSTGLNSADAFYVVIGFVGGFVRHDDTVHSPVQVGERIRKDYPSRVYVKVFENRRRAQAHQEVLRLLDTNRDGKLSDEEKGQAKIILYGMSWGGSETVALARELQAERIPVLLTIQVDSVEKIQENDEVIPANVAEAVNFYQSDGFLHGRSEIRAEDPSRTKILGNFHFSYPSMPSSCENYPWWDRWFVKPHTEIECDPTVWNKVEALIRAELPPPVTREVSQR
jgi:hypothetical protein